MTGPGRLRSPPRAAADLQDQRNPANPASGSDFDRDRPQRLLGRSEHGNSVGRLVHTPLQLAGRQSIVRELGRSADRKPARGRHEHTDQATDRSHRSGIPRASLPFAGPARRRRPRIEAQSQVEAGADRGQQSQGPGPDASVENGQRPTRKTRGKRCRPGPAARARLARRLRSDHRSEHDTGIVGEAILTLTRHGDKPDQILRTLRSVRIRALDLGLHVRPVDDERAASMDDFDRQIEGKWPAPIAETEFRFLMRVQQNVNQSPERDASHRGCLMTLPRPALPDERC